MNRLWSGLLIGVVALILSNCQSESSTGTVIRGTLQNAQDLQVFIDQAAIGKANHILAKAEIDPQGNFQLAFPEGLEAGVYKLRVGAQQAFMVLDGDESEITIDGDVRELQRYGFDVSGSASSQVLQQTMAAVTRNEFDASDLINFIDTVSNPVLSAVVSYRVLPQNSGSAVELQKRAAERATKDAPGNEFAQQYATFVTNLDRQYQQYMAKQLIRVGQEAPNISLPSPNGRNLELEELEGKIVLLDFWASWCGPCRRENPNVVKVYDKYKNQGFTIYSVSLDGMDSRTARRFNEEQQKDLIERSRKKWIAAIADDNLKWDYHVSDLKKWESSAATQYGVSAIPQTFLIDRDGKIAKIGLRGASQIEQALKELL